MQKQKKNNSFPNFSYKNFFFLEILQLHIEMVIQKDEMHFLGVHTSKTILGQ